MTLALLRRRVRWRATDVWGYARARQRSSSFAVRRTQADDNEMTTYRPQLGFARRRSATLSRYAVASWTGAVGRRDNPSDPLNGRPRACISDWRSR